MKKIFPLFMLIMISFNVFGQVSYTGTIGEYPIKFVIQDDEYPEYFSYYYYTKHHELIALKGEAFKIDSLEYTSKVVFYEKDKIGKNKATLTFEEFNLKHDQLNGIWTDLISKKQLKIELIKNREEPISKKDSIIIENHLRKLQKKLNAEQRVARNINPNESQFEPLVKKLLNGDKKTAKLFPEIGWSRGDFEWINGNVHYAPDKSFKIFVFEGSNGFTYTEFESFVLLESGKKVKGGSSFAPIVSLFKTGTNTYVAIENGWDSSNGYYNLEQFSIVNDSLIKVPFTGESLKLKDYNKTIYDPDIDSDYIGFGNFFGFNMRYNIANKKIQFRYPKMKFELFNNRDNSVFEKDLAKKIPKRLLPFQDDEALLVKGEFEIINGKIANYKEWYEKKKKKEIYDEN